MTKIGRKWFLALILVAGCPLPLALGAGVEVFFDLYAGVAETRDSQVSVQLNYFHPEPHAAEGEAEFESSAVGGVRVGLWPKRFPWVGAALDLSAYRAESPIADLTVVPLSALLMLRWPLWREADFPGGRLQPYLAVGPSLIYAELDVDLRPLVEDNVSGWTLENGWDFRGGLAWQFHRRCALFGEYRYLQFHVDYEEEDLGWFFGWESNTIAKTELDVDTHQFLTGLSFRF